MNIKNMLLQAFNDCSTTIAKKDNSNYIHDVLSQIISELNDRKYISEKFSHFAVKDPVLREIFAPAFKDRIVQRFLIHQIENPIDKQFYEYNCGNRKNKGGHYAIKNIKKWIKNKDLKYYLQIDIQSFFRNIDHNILWKSIEPKIRNITTFSQKQINLFLQQKLELSLHPKKTKLQPIHNGINFLGYIIRPHYSLIRKRTIKNFKQKLYFFNHLFNPTEFPNPIVPVKNELSYLYKSKMITAPIAPTADILQMMLSTINTYYGLMNHANTHTLRWSLYHNNFKELKKYFKQVSFFETDKNNVQHEKSMIYIKPYFLQIKEFIND